MLRQPAAAGLVATATLGVPAAVVELGLANGRIDAGQGAAIVAAALVSIGVGAAGVRLLPATPEPQGRYRYTCPGAVRIVSRWSGSCVKMSARQWRSARSSSRSQLSTIASALQTMPGSARFSMLYAV